MSTANVIAHRDTSDETLELLRKDFLGPILRPGDDDYDRVREIWNAMYDARPAVILRCTGTADVIAAVNFAREGGWKPAVRGGGHGAPGYSVADDELMIDLSLMAGATIDPKAKTATVAGGAIWQTVDQNAQLYGLATVGGTVSETGVAGLSLGGGYGWLSRKYGLTVDNLLRFEIVTADGQVRHVDADSDPDLFWALRGGGGNFGVVTSFTFQLHDVGPTVLGGRMIFPLADAAKVMRFYRDYAPTTPRELGIHAFAGMVPPMAPFPEKYWGDKYVTLMLCYHGDVAEGEKVIAPLREMGIEPMFDDVGPIAYRDHQQLLDKSGPAPYGHRSYWKSGMVVDLTDEAIDDFISNVKDSTSPLTLFELSYVEGAANEVDPRETAYSNRHGRFNNVIVFAWDDPAQDDEMVAGARAAYDRMSPHLDSVYSNYLGREEVGRVREAYDAETWERLQAIKRRFDPTNLFSRNQNIPPN